MESRGLHDCTWYGSGFAKDCKVLKLMETSWEGQGQALLDPTGLVWEEEAGPYPLSSNSHLVLLNPRLLGIC